MKLHTKGFLLVTLRQFESLWDQNLIEKTCTEYNLSGYYNTCAISIALDELASAGLVERLEEKLINKHNKQILSFRYKLSPFGEKRMHDTGLLT